MRMRILRTVQLQGNSWHRHGGFPLMHTVVGSLSWRSADSFTSDTGSIYNEPSKRMLMNSRTLHTETSKNDEEEAFFELQEATAVGIKSMMREQDTVITSYRAHGWYYLMSGSAVGLLSELTGKASGCSRGKGGSMHLYSRNFYGGNGIVGAQVPLGTGIALHHKLRETTGISFTIYGDGAANQGQVFESFNMAKLWNLPIIYVCENNHYGMGTSSQRSSADEEYYKRGDYIPGIKVDGMDVLAVREATSFAISHCQSGKGPIIVEMDTYRYHGHSTSDPGTGYRSRDEVAIVKENKDPITNLRDRMVSSELATDSEFKDIGRQVRVEIEQAAGRAREDPEPVDSEIASHIYKHTCNDIIRGCVNCNDSYREPNQSSLKA